MYPDVQLFYFLEITFKLVTHIYVILSSYDERPHKNMIIVSQQCC